MDTVDKKLDEAVKMLKLKAGISISEKDEYIKIICQGVLNEIININGIEDFDIVNRLDDFLLLVDYSEWRYSSRGEGGYYEFRAPNGEGANILPQHLAWRLKNRYLMIDRV